MAEQDLKHYGRKELIELLYQSEKKNADLRKELEAEQQNSKQLEERLAQRRLDVTEAGNLADAVIRVNGVYEAAQAAAEDYLLNIKSLSADQDRILAEREAKSKKDAEELLKATSRQCSKMQKDTEAECWEMEEQTKRNCEAIKVKAREEVESYWKELQERLESFYEEHKGMRELMMATNIHFPQF